MVLVCGYDIHSTARIGLSVVCPRRLEMGARSRIGHLTVCKGLSVLKLGAESSVGNLNWITGFPGSLMSSFAGEADRRAELVIGPHSAITNRHLIDCTNAVIIGAFSTLAGFRSQLLTHSIDLDGCCQKSGTITIGDYCFVGTACIVLAGSSLPSYSVLGAHSLLNRPYSDEYRLYAGSPARPLRPLSTGLGYFHRAQGRVS